MSPVSISLFSLATSTSKQVAGRAKKVKNKPMKNESYSDEVLLRKYQKEVVALKRIIRT